MSPEIVEWALAQVEAKPTAADSPADVLVAVAREWLEGTEIRWCVEHDSAVSDPIDGDPDTCARGEWEPYVFEESGPCRIVAARLVGEESDTP